MHPVLYIQYVQAQPILQLKTYRNDSGDETSEGVNYAGYYCVPVGVKICL